jgi:hypothetical protein
MMSARIFLAMALCALPAVCQQDMGLITGIVTDASGGTVPSARVTVLNPETNETRIVDTSETGTYTVGPLRVGTYTLSVEKTGFKKAVWPEIRVSAQDRVRADVLLELGQISEQVSVTTEAPLLNSETATVAHVVSQGQIRQLPLNGRNFQQLAWMTAGVIPSTGSRDRESGFNSHGQPITQNNFIIDGVDNNNNVMGMQDRKSQVVVPSLDAVAEFKVQTSNYSAEFGRNSGAVMIVNLKSGTNAFHGTAFEYLRNDRTDARDAFTYVDRTGDGRADPEILKQHQFGATLGGPIVKNKLFFFGSWERRTQRRSQTDLAITPTSLEKNGMFSRRVNDPLTGQAFPDNTIPRSRFDAVAAGLLALWPEPNFGGSGTRQNFTATPPWNNDRDQFDTRIDWDASEKDKIFGRYSRNRTDNLRGSVFAAPARGAQNNDRAFDDDDANSAVFSWTRLLSPTLVNEFRYGFSRQKVDKRELSEEPMRELMDQYGIRGIPAYDRLYGLPRFAFAGAVPYEGLGEPGSMPNFKIHQVHQYLNNLSWYRGNHNFKVGGDLRWNRTDIFGGNQAHGNFNFDGQFTGVSFADFLLGYPASFNLSTLLPGQMRFQSYMFFVQDDWKVTPRLTLNLGIRYEFTTPWYDKHDNMTKLNLTPGPGYGDIVRAGHCGDSLSCRALVESDTNNWAPRLGFAYQVTEATVLRGGVGVFYGGQGSLGADGRMISNFPFVRSVTLQSTPARPALQLAQGVPSDMLGDGSTPPENLNWRVWQDRFPLPTIYQWNMAVQRETFRDFSVTVAYVGSSSNYVLGSYNWNGSGLGPLATEQQRRPMPQWNNVALTSPYGHASYHGLDVQLDKRYSNGIAFTAAYTWAHSIDNVPEQFGPGGGGLTDLLNFDLSRGNSNFDIRHRFVTSGIWEVPGRTNNRFLNGMLTGWQLSGLLSMQSGNPFTLTVPNARQRLGATAIGDWWPDRISSGVLDDPTPEMWFDTAAFASPRNPDGTWRLGNAGRGILRTDSLFNVDAGLMKNFKITESVGLQFRWEVFNITNTPTLGTPVTNFESPDFGTVRSTVSTPRQMQFALRLSW